MLVESVPLLLGFLLLGISGILLLLGGRRRRKKVIELDLEADWQLRHLSPTWVKDGLVRQIDLEVLMDSWRAVAPPKKKEAAAPELTNHRSRGFFESQIRSASCFENAPAQKRICAQLLELLDREGDCPSVVVAGGKRTGSEAKAYQALARITLLDHSLDVALAMIEVLTERMVKQAAADGLIAALAHDLGKLPSLRGEIYASADHPATAGTFLLNKVEGFKTLPRYEEILQAVKQHHKPYRNMGLLAECLILADQRARERELQTMARRHDGSPQPGPESLPAYELPDSAAPRAKRIGKFFLPPELKGEGLEGEGEKVAADRAGEPQGQAEMAASKKSIENSEAETDAGTQEAKQENSAEEEGIEDFLTYLPDLSAEKRTEPEKLDQMAAAASETESVDGGNQGGRAGTGKKFQKHDPRLTEVAAWYDEGILKREIRQAVNIVTNGCWNVFSVPEGYLYCKGPVLESAIRKMAAQAEYEPVIGIGEGDIEGMRPYFNALVDHLRDRDEEIIARGLIKDGYFGGYFRVTMETPRGGVRVSTNFFTPFHADWLGTVEEFEKNKPNRIRRIRSVKPDTTRRGNA